MAAFTSPFKTPAIPDFSPPLSRMDQARIGRSLRLQNTDSLLRGINEKASQFRRETVNLQPPPINPVNIAPRIQVGQFSGFRTELGNNIDVTV
ncbi:MAG: hypothetical protein GF333_03315 [Candidatus Omnitrophica bacterium]|nr:hypothetical protein [Candidatus Omnitrophota bacterium]